MIPVDIVVYSEEQGTDYTNEGELLHIIINKIEGTISFLVKSNKTGIAEEFVVSVNKIIS